MESLLINLLISSPLSFESRHPKLVERGWLLANYCSMCKNAKELVDHLLVHCGKARGSWHFLFSLFGILWVLPYLVKDLLMH